MCRALGLFLTHKQCDVETGQMSSVARSDICLASTHNVEVSEFSSASISQCSSLRSLICGNITTSKSQIGGPTLNPQKNELKWVQNGRQDLRIGCLVGVRDLVARGYFIPGRTSQRGGGRAPAFRVACCRTSSDMIGHDRT